MLEPFDLFSKGQAVLESDGMSPRYHDGMSGLESLDWEHGLWMRQGVGSGSPLPGVCYASCQSSADLCIDANPLSRYLNFAQDILYDTLHNIPDAAIAMPRTREAFQRLSDLITDRHRLLDGPFGSIDGLSLAAQEADDPELENATFNGWKSEHRVNNVIAFSPEGVVIAAVLNCPGSWHDSHVSCPIFEKLRTQVPEGFYLIADTGFPRGTASIAGKIRAPLKGGERVPADPVEQDYVLCVNRELLSYRSQQNGVCEHFKAHLDGFGCLSTSPQVVPGCAC
ncbi:putative DDE superfamily endonuclease [Lyophyllum shimeji]|uniref:DDE superfamily endonuclease n=1 Tax=Lyophyllum shimeji TaxID=47721 RepID=A0A9P3PYU0_LYOSH|nr:putative DDE superfamily endonuclease [Lyophyllum shimeji]